MFKLFPIAPASFAKLFGRQNIFGYVDLIEWGTIQGWVLRNERRSISLVLRVDGQNYPLTPSWLERSDVAQKHGIKFKFSGYHCTLSAELEEVLKNAIQWGQKIEVLADGVALENIAKLPKLVVQLQPEQLGIAIESVEPKPEPLGLEIDAVEMKGEIEQWGHFILSGWVMLNKQPATLFGLLCNGKELDCTALRINRPDISQIQGVDALDIGFKIELPGYLWENVSENEDALIEIQIDGQTLDLTPLVLSKEKTVRWIDDIVYLKEGQEKQYWMLLALEHIRYGDFMSLLQKDEALYIRKFAENMQLEDFVLTNPTFQTETEVPAESFETLLLWRALRILNTRFTENQPIFALIKTIINELKLVGDVQDQFLFSIIPLLCKTDEFIRLRELIDFKCLKQQSDWSSLYDITISIPAILADGYVNWATAVVYKIAKTFESVRFDTVGWLNTECIYFSVRLVQCMETDGKIEIEEAEKFRYAIIALLDAFNGQYFSRLHDQMLIDSLLLIVAGIDRYTDYHRHDVVIAAQRIYGLNPDFWERANTQQVDILDSELVRAHAHFKNLYLTLTAERASLKDWLEKIAEPLAYYRAKNNPEAVIFLREICANILPDINESLPTRAKALLAKLLAADPAEAIRIAAFPLPAENCLLDVFPETMPLRLRETLRELSNPSKSVVWQIQENASVAMRSLLDLDTVDRREVENRIKLLEQRAMALANWRGGFLAFDLIASGYIVASSHNLECSMLLTRLQQILKKAVEETKSDCFLPAPLLAGFFSLGHYIEKTDPMLLGFLAESRRLIRAKYGERMDELFTSPKQLQMRLGAIGWPQDTLVVIYSCRKYLDTRVKAIRETWVQDLKALKIPYLVLVGDGDDTIRGDVLALNVSDKYEDLPKKSLKLFDWVYQNTDAQYVLKIDDDCYLNVGRFFDTLSYRKHFYYGRVIRRNIGDMDRCWHQPKSNTQHARKNIDKSPEPAVYADGGGGYTLSRMAMQQLLNVAKTKQGEQLLACSFMEDKLIGDLLRMCHVEPNNEDYDSYQRRRTFGEALPVGMWENTFFPCQSTPTKVTHLDNDLDLATTHDRVDGRELWPKKLWPTCWRPSISGNNQLELLTDTLSVKALLEQNFLVISVVRNEIVMLPHFLAHYRKQGVKCFVIVDNCSDDGTREYLFQQPDVVLYSTDTEYKYSYYGVAWQQAVLGNLCLGKWVLLADADEFLVFENSETRTLEDFVANIESEGCDAVCTVMVDMYPKGDLSEADFTKGNPFDLAPWFDNPPVETWRLGSGWFSNSMSYTSNLRHRVVAHAMPHDFISQKYALLRYAPWIRLSQGLHYASNLTVSRRPSWFAHFKYHSGLKEKVETEIRRGQHYNNAAEYRRYAAMLAEGQGGFRKVGVSKRYSTSADFAPYID